MARADGLQRSAGQPAEAPGPEVWVRPSTPWGPVHCPGCLAESWRAEFDGAAECGQRFCLACDAWVMSCQCAECTVQVASLPPPSQILARRRAFGWLAEPLG